MRRNYVIWSAAKGWHTDNRPKRLVVTKTGRIRWEIEPSEDDKQS